MSADTNPIGEIEDGLLARARAKGWISALDQHFAARLAALDPGSDGGVRWALAIACRQEAAGHVCADLPRLARTGLVTEGEGPGGADAAGAGVRADEAGSPIVPLLVTHPTLEEWLGSLGRSALVERVPSPEIPSSPELPPAREDAGRGEAFGREATPLVLDASGRLYLRRAFAAECALADRLASRARAADLAVDGMLAEAGIERLAPALAAAPAPAPAAPAGAGRVGGEASAEREDPTRTALRVGLARPLAVVTGGPGTGKTTMVARLVALLVEQRQARGEAPLRVRLLAPTGKAATALGASFARQRDTLDVSDAVRAALPGGAETLHRALHRQTRRDAFGRPQAIRIEADVVVVDEASMVDLATMARLFEACVDVERIVLLGDPDQLASVESGAVLAELCAGAWSEVTRAAPSRSSRAASSDAARPTLADSFVRLHTSHRFRGEGGIGLLAAAIRDGDADAALALLADPSHPEVERFDADSIDAVRGRLARHVRAMQHAIGEASDASEKLARLGLHRVLCAHRRGALGVEALCALLDEVAAAERRTSSRAGWFRGRLLLVTRNAPEQDLWNGDVGLVEETPTGLRALFPAPSGGVRSLAAGRLPAHESAIAMSVHKSQGSEFDEVDLVLGAKASPLMTRELLYTGVTRARERLRLHASEAVLRTAIARRIERDSALAARLRSAFP